MTENRPRRRTRSHAATAAGAFAAAFALTATGGLPANAAPPDVPTWEEVQAAQRSEESKKAEIAKIEAIVSDLQQRAADLAKVAMERAEDALIAQSELADAEAKTSRLAAQLEDAEARASSSATLAASLVSRLARQGGGDTSALLAFSSAEDADLLLSRLGTMEKLSATSTALVEQALFDKRAVTSLAEEAELAEDERRSRAGAAVAAQEEAAAAAESLTAQVAEQEANMSVLYQQLALLKGTTAELIREYYEGIVVTPAPTTPAPAPQPTQPGQPAQPTTPPAPPTQPTTPPTQPTTPPSSGYPTPNASAVSGAIAFARQQLGERYQLGGMGPDVWDCSGLTKASYASVGVYIGTHSSTDQYNYMKRQGRLVPYSQVQPGDLIFYSDGGSADNPRKYHVTMYVGDGKMIEAPNPSATVRVVNVRNSDRVAYVGRPTG
ncbi:C40 family peptidase [Salinibacterium sp. ZJ70]|uniref:C40 family peptidase n=1 Tax=Salinibacterium sp. ZJ70 TaxID=2708084 RepID=UPI001422F4B8|nr:C40 family peptidase [Salinibacterium sp. ZJ70]